MFDAMLTATAEATETVTVYVHVFGPDATRIESDSADVPVNNILQAALSAADTAGRKHFPGLTPTPRIVPGIGVEYRYLQEFGVRAGSVYVST